MYAFKNLSISFFFLFLFVLFIFLLFSFSFLLKWMPLCHSSIWFRITSFHSIFFLFLNDFSIKLSSAHKFKFRRTGFNIYEELENFFFSFFFWTIFFKENISRLQRINFTPFFFLNIFIKKKNNNKQQNKTK